MFAYELLNKIATQEESKSGNYSKDTVTKAMLWQSKYDRERIDFLENVSSIDIYDFIDMAKKFDEDFKSKLTKFL